MLTSTMTTFQAGLTGDEDAYCPENLECAPYKVLNRTTDIEVRHYPPALFVSTNIDEGYYKSGKVAFSRLFNYISGGNARGQRIPMTAPVTTKMNLDTSGPYSISFYVPHKVAAQGPPAPGENTVYLEHRPGFVATVLSFGGWAYQKRVLESVQAVVQMMKDCGIEIEDKYAYVAGFSSPWQILHRHNEVWIIWATNSGAQDKELLQRLPESGMMKQAVDQEVVEDITPMLMDEVKAIIEAADDPHMQCHNFQDEQSCDLSEECSWCASMAIPSSCYPKELAQRLPPAVFHCDGF